MPRLTIRRRDERGFSLIELMVTLLIFGILAALAVPAWQNQQKAAMVSTLKSDVRNAVSSTESALVAYPNASGFIGYYSTQPQTISGVVPVKITSQSTSDVIKFTNTVPVGNNPTAATGQGAAGAYQITGTNTNLPGYYYTYNSTNRIFYDSTGTQDSSWSADG